MRSQHRRPSPLRRFLGWVLTLALGLLIGVGWPVVVRPALVVNQDAAYPGAQAGARWVPDVGGYIDIQPVGTPAKVLLIYYPGGLVRPQAYQWLGTALAPLGVRTVIPAFPLDLAVTGVNRADGLTQALGQGQPVYLAGHSLGGAMAAQYARQHADQLRGLILMGAYPAGNTDLKPLKLRVLSLLAERDGVAQPAEVQGGLERLPPDTRLTIIPGAVHSFFGRSGPQRGDGTPTVPRQSAEADIVAAVRGFMAPDLIQGAP